MFIHRSLFQRFSCSMNGKKIGWTNCPARHPVFAFPLNPSILFPIPQLYLFPHLQAYFGSVACSTEPFRSGVAAFSRGFTGTLRLTGGLHASSLCYKVAIWELCFRSPLAQAVSAQVSLSEHLL